MWISELGLAARRDPELHLLKSIPQLRSSQQLIIVTTTGWNEVNATVRLLERKQAGTTPWEQVGTSFPALIGRRGFAWGIGLHGTGEPGMPIKKEGDQRSPAGLFRLYAVFGIADAAQVSFVQFSYEKVAASTEAIDDPESKYYNRIVDRTAIKQPDWSTSEKMLAVPDQYKLGLMIEHNWSQYPGFGSCIFFHVWNPNRLGTSGCTATSLANLERLLHWLDVKQHPLILQLPLPEYDRLKQSWELP